MDRLPKGPPTPVFRKPDGGMRPAQEIRPTPHKHIIKRTQGVTKTIVTLLSALAENFTPRKTSRKTSTSRVPTDIELDRSLSRTGPGKSPHDIIEIDTAMIGAAYPTGMNKSMAMADVAGAGDPASTGAGEMRFLAVAEVYSPVGEVKGDPQTGDRKVGHGFSTPEEEVSSHPLEHSGVEKWVGPRDGSTKIDFIAPEEDVGSHPLEHSGVEKWVGPRDGSTKFDFIAPEEDVGSHPLEHSGVEKWVGPRDGSTKFDFIAPEEDVGSHPLEHSGVEKWADPGNGSIEISLLEDPGVITKSAPISKLVEWEPLEHSVPSVTLCWESEPPIADVQEEPEEGEAIVVGAVGSAAPWFLTGWTNDVEVEFMIDTGCQVTILATSFSKRCVRQTRKSDINYAPVQAG